MNTYRRSARSVWLMFSITLVAISPFIDAKAEAG